MSFYYDDTDLTLDPMLLTTRGLVADGFVSASSYTSSAVTAANGFMESLSRIAGDVNDIPDISAEIGAMESTIRELVLPATPTHPGDMDFNPQAAPVPPTLTPVTMPSLPQAPIFSAVRPAVDFDAISKPEALSANVPSAPTLFDVNLPSDPVYTMPEAPSMIPISLPGEPELDIPSFDAAVPDAPGSPSVPTFSFTEPEYVSSLLDTLKAKLESWVGGESTGLDPDVEQAIFDRGRARENANATRLLGEVRRSFASRGFNMPPGAMAIAMQRAVQETNDKISGLNREIIIAQADLEQKNRQFAATSAIQTEGALLQHHNGMATRAYEAARYTVESAVALYQLIITRYSAQVQAYNSQAQVFRTLVDAALAKLEVYRAQLDGQRLIGELNRIESDVYTSRLQGVLAIIETYKQKVEAAKVISDVNNSKISAFGGEVEAYRAQVQAKASEYDAYSSEIQAEATKLEAYRVDAQAYQSEVSGYEALVRAKTAATEIEARVNQEIPLDRFKAETEIFRSNVAAESERLRALSSVYNTDVSAFSAIAGAKASQVQADAQKYQSESAHLLQEAELRLTSLRANVDKMLGSIDLVKEIAKTGGIISSQLAASALSMVNLNASLGSSDSFSQSLNTSKSENVNYNYS